MRPFIILSLVIAMLPLSSFAKDPVAIQDALQQVGIPADGSHRGQVDIIGFASTAAQMDAVVRQAQDLAAERSAQLDNSPLIAAVCPHDDYYYASRLYQLVLPRIKAKTVVLFGVFHKARLFDADGKLVFDSFQTWHGPYGPVKVSPLRDDIIAGLPDGSYLVDNDAHMVEHSLEAIVPWLQYYNREVEIVPVLVSYMDCETMTALADQFVAALEPLLKQKGWTLGEDIAFISSADAVHYGDAGWGGSNFAEFGTDVPGYQKAVDRDLNLAQNYLTGPLTPEKLQGFLHSCADRNDIKHYKITWCGRFSIPFGLLMANGLTTSLQSRPLTGTLLDYGTSVSEASLELDEFPPMGVTAPNNLRHWVGYAAIGYR